MIHAQEPLHKYDMPPGVSHVRIDHQGLPLLHAVERRLRERGNGQHDRIAHSSKNMPLAKATILSELLRG